MSRAALDTVGIFVGPCAKPLIVESTSPPLRSTELDSDISPLLRALECAWGTAEWSEQQVRVPVN